MPNDAKMGLVLGVGLVIAVGVLYFRKEPGPIATAGNSEATAGQTTSASGRGQYRLTRSGMVTPASGGLLKFRRHSVVPEDTLSSLAEQYYGDREKATLIQRANPRLADPDSLAPGTTLVIPDLPP